ncbi:aldehyde dehydrogenase [Actinokineospora sp. UTMC 2448]|uniref:aldehyde dehydrogenase family protein n=1 Tax=Actinokineospora sp. UTMC 2448 TaxID=2268449 RepID=UPI00220AAF13|nr:Lactaldehyde dehydrogenase [Actinokineospora sp. UTMC 2448]
MAVTELMPHTEPYQVVDRAERAFPAWAATDPAERGARLHRAADAMAARLDDLAEANHADTGRPRDEARASVEAGIGTLRQYAELGPLHRGRALQGGWNATDLMIPQPRGVVVALTPWNDPVPVACGLLGAALVTGNTAVHKPSERACRTGALLAELLAEALPEDVVQTVFGAGEVGAALAANPHVAVVAHVGSTHTGRSIAMAAAATGAKALLENGGNDAAIVDCDVDPAWAAAQVALGAYANGGQVCTSVERVFVHQDVAAPFLDALVKEAERWNDTLCPLVDANHRAGVHRQVTDAVSAGAALATGGTLPSGAGSWYPATVLTDCTPVMSVMTEETFGPVAPVMVVSDFAEGLALAAEDRHGLAASVFTADMANAQRAWRTLDVGTVKVNAVFGGAPGGAAQPRRLSGTGFGYGPELLDEMTTTKVVHLSPPGGAP